MKYFLGLMALLLAGFLVNVSFYSFQRWMISAELQTVLASCDRSSGQTPSEKWLKEHTCALVEQENEQFQQAAKHSTTRKEFRQKCDALLSQWAEEDAMDRLLREYETRKRANKWD